ncbi:nuclear pore complex subunit Nup159, putative [Trichophyton benhamiae CBS 112371]|uniref:Nuclear pore complex subunit Nup159, putative n=1 Tax=Arthroderma benhamiae (strain ATCC MYA-4681 / CBS 112371) TaxID=663331 RepID=D4AKX5_ARTBC|nr:nuclear pore complex subunit Nup159, putative [Trichophyton benhamiae CBS 112371]EFE36034.1 nuclear pore complex subunit Nup159, putative [Trichophyton benhamiae CBS 112371]
MAFSFGSGSSQAAGGKVTTGAELQEIETQQIGFLSIGHNAKVKLLPTPWPEDSLPAPTASLLSVTSVKGLLAAAGPEGIAIARTDSVRKAYASEPVDGSDVRTFQPELQIPLPKRVSHLAFSADGSALVVAVDGGDALAIYDVSGLLQGRTQPTATLNINGATLRALAANPNPDTSELFAAVTTNGELLIANLKTNQLVSGSAGPVLKSGVSSVCWSNKGTQLVAGLGDGSAYQVKPDGEKQADIPRAPEIGSDHHATRKPPDQYEFRKLPEVSAPFGLARHPAYQFTARMRDFEPHLKEALIIASTASTDIGLITQSTADGTPTFAALTMADDSRRAVLPMTEDMNDTSPIGMCLDLSSRDSVISPVPGDEEIKESSSPLPALLVLTNDGMLSSWWFVHTESIKQQKPYSGLVAVNSKGQQSQPQITSTQPAVTTTTPAKSPFGQAGFGQSTFGKPATPSFGMSSALGMQSKPAFGSPSPLGSFSQTPGGSSTTPGFGSSTPQTSGGISFGSPGNLGSNSPAFGQTGALGAGRSLFGQPSIGSGGLTTGSGFANIGAGGGFGSFASSGGGFASAAQTAAPSASPFGKPSSKESPFGQPASTESPFAKTSSNDNPFAKAGQPLFGEPNAPTMTTSPFGQQVKNEKSSTSFGLGTGGFTVGSTMKPDTSAAMDEDKPEQSSGSLSMGAAFGDMLGGMKSNIPKLAAPKSAELSISSTPTSAPPASIFSSHKQTQSQDQKAPSFSNLFNAPPQQEKPLPTAKTTTPTGSFSMIPVVKKAPSTPGEPIHSPATIRAETPKETPRATPPTPLAKAVEAPLPPESTSKLSYAPGDTSASSSGVSRTSIEDAPLPPDFVKPKKEEAPKEATDVSLPAESEEGDADFEDSGEDVGHDLSPTDEAADHRVQSLKTSPESSFGGAPDKSPMSDLFTKGGTSELKTGGGKTLFGEISKPIFPPPTFPEPRHRLSPRSPSPVRSRSGQMLARADGFRSTSAPSAPDRAITRRKATLEGSMLARQVSPSRDLAEDQAKAKREAEKLAAETQPLCEDDEDEQLRADLARPISPSPSLDPFLPHQGYTGESMKPGIPGQIELLFRDINTMIDTLGINSRSLSSFLLYEESAKENDYKRWLRTLRSDKCSDLLNERQLLSEVDKLRVGVDALDEALQKGRIEGVQEMFDQCQQLISKDLVTLRGQFANLQRTLDAHTDSIAIASAPLTPEQAALQQDLRKAATDTRSKVADLERDITVFRAKIADASRLAGVDGDRKMARPTVEAVTSTISTMTNMAERKSGDVDVLEAQLRRMGIDVSASPAPGRSREASPFLTPAKKTPAGRFPVTPGSQGSQDGYGRSVYQTPESAAAQRFRSSLLGRSSSVQGTNTPDMVVSEDLESWRTKTARRKEVVGHLRSSLSKRKVKIRTLDS